MTSFGDLEKQNEDITVRKISLCNNLRHVNLRSTLTARRSRTERCSLNIRPGIDETNLVMVVQSRNEFLRGIELTIQMK